VKGLVTEPLLETIKDPSSGVSRVWAIGPPRMMWACSEATRPFAIPTIVSLNSLMVDGTGMCGGCRVDVGGQVRFTCVHGPEFDGHAIDWNNFFQRQNVYHEQEQCSLTRHLREKGVV